MGSFEVTMTYFMTPKVTVTFVGSLNQFMTQKVTESVQIAVIYFMTPKVTVTFAVDLT